jgi:hypothetical protein
MKRLLLRAVVAAAAVACLGLVTPSSLRADTLWATGNDGNALITIDTVTGAATVIGPSGRSGFFGNAFANNGTMYGLTGWAGPATLVTVNQTTGATTPVTGVPNPTALPLEIDTAGNAFSIGYVDSLLYRVNRTTGTFTPIGNTGVNAVMDIAYDASGTLWATVNNRLWTIDTTTGASTLKGTMLGVQNIMGIAFDNSNQLIALDFTSTSAVYRVNTTTFAATKIADTGISFAHGGDIQIQSAVVPLPAAAVAGLALMSGTAAFSQLRRRTRAARAEA